MALLSIRAALRRFLGTPRQVIVLRSSGVIFRSSLVVYPNCEVSRTLMEHSRARDLGAAKLAHEDVFDFLFASSAAYYTQDDSAMPADGPQPPPRAFRLAQFQALQRLPDGTPTPSRIIQSEQPVLPERPIVDEKTGAEDEPRTETADLGAMDKSSLDRHLEEKIQALQQHLAAARAEMDIRAEACSQARSSKRARPHRHLETCPMLLNVGAKSSSPI
jgi:hypothetical protein